jgi:anti-sigma factor RsiW
MTCESARKLVEAFVDDELDASERVQFEGHLEGCSACAEERGRLLKLRADIRNDTLYYRAPAQMRDRIDAGLRRAERPGAVAWRVMAIAASIMLAVSLVWNVTQFRSRQDQLADYVLANHIRSLMGAHLMDVASADQHTVKPWFNGKLDFSPDVKDFAAEGFPLIGGRLDYMNGRAVAALVYRRRQHIINLFTWPAAGDTGRTNLARNGYQAIHWTQSGMEYWAVSDVSAGDLRQFEDLYRR